MKKIIIISVVILLIISMSFTKEVVRSSELPEDLEFTWHAGSIGGTYFIMGAAITDVLDANIEEFNGVVVPGGAFGNVVEVARGGERRIAQTYIPTAVEGYEGTGEYADAGFDEGFKEIRGLVALGYGGVSHWVVTPNIVPEGVTKLGEFLEHEPPVEVSVGPRGTGGEIAVRMILEQYGVTYDDIENWGGEVVYTSYSDASDAIRDGHLNALWNSMPAFHPGITDLATTRDVIFLSIEEEVLEIMENEHNRIAYTVQAGTYPGQDYDWISPYEGNMIIVHEDLEDEVAYEFTKLILENKERWVNAFRGMQGFEPSNAHEFPIPIHPGAEKAFRELGFLD